MGERYLRQTSPYVVPPTDGKLIEEHFGRASTGESAFEALTLEAGQSILVRRNARVRYSNPFPAEVEYLSVCLPAFAPELAHRQGEEPRADAAGAPSG